MSFFPNDRVSVAANHLSSSLVPAIVLITALSAGQASDVSSAQVIPVQGDVQGIHDPSIIKDGNTWYIFSTRTGDASEGELPIHCSQDLRAWKSCGSVFKAVPDWIKKDSPETKELWAPDISYFNGLYHLYYAFSAFGKNTSGIALLTNKTLDPKDPNYRWNDDGLVLLSRKSDDFNAIDPNLVLDDKGGAWLAFGSFWGGIKMRRIDPQTGKLSAQDTTLYSLAARKPPANPEPSKPGLPADWQAIEAPFIVNHGGYYYLFVSYDLCCRGVKSDYKIAVGRSRNPNGPYVDEAGEAMAKGGGSVILIGNDRWLGPGGESALHRQDGFILVFHAYDSQSGKPSLQVSTIAWKDGWPHLALAGGKPDKQ